MVDADDFTEAPAPIAPKATVSAGKKLVALLEYPANQDKWWQSGLDGSNHGFEQSSEVEDFGIVDDRDDMLCIGLGAETEEGSWLGLESAATFLFDGGKLGESLQWVHLKSS